MVLVGKHGEGKAKGPFFNSFLESGPVWGCSFVWESSYEHLNPKIPFHDEIGWQTLLGFGVPKACLEIASGYL